MDFEDERKKLFNEIWKEPMTTVAKRYGISDNGLRKRCIKLEIPLPPTGHWAKLQAGKNSTPQPKLPPLKVAQHTIYEKDLNQYQCIELIDVENQSSEQLKGFDGLELLTPKSKENFLKWCSKIQVPKKNGNYDPLIIECQNEIAYRKARDEEHQFRDVFRYSMMLTESKIKYRNNKAVLPIFVSDKQANRAFRIIDTLIKAANDLNGKVIVEVSQKDNAIFRLFGHTFSLQMNESMVKRRSLLSSSSSEKVSTDFRPMYEKVFSGMLEIEFKESMGYWEKDKTPKVYKFVDSVDSSIENQLGEIFKTLYKSANEAKIANIIADRESEIKEKEKIFLRKMEEEKRKILQQFEERSCRKKQLVQNIEQQMQGWFKSQRLRKYAEELERYALETSDEVTKELLSVYITLVHRKADNCDPVTDILNEIKSIGPKEMISEFELKG